ncbi:Gmad2 immunoglobulin-like domain-containing protein [Cellulomonas fimi]|uniref:GerMN domain-containing protein n=1 Tax=Cellulomonas fimi TaxID=1708 RepID=A0A7Y0LX08_CELFI|nr:Gmad2 immunoglobulin-like domain-containing protein [Cellulomonas fimi]NMR19464.1 hypothetical protein [Cellulomonas fimi]
MATHRTRRRPWRGALLVLALGVLLGSCATTPGGDPTPSEPPPTSAAPTPSPTPPATAEPRPTTAYFVVDTRAGLRLARDVGPGSATDPVQAAVERMIEGPADPDYTTSWNPETEVLGVTRDGTTLVVDLSAEARTASVGSEGAALMIQQLVHTASEAAEEPGAGVLLTIDGAPAGELWGAVTWDEPVTRADPLDVRLLVQIDVPVEGATTTSPVTVSGEAAVFEANLLWRVVDLAGTEIASGFATTAEGQTFAPYSFTVELPAGTYQVVITEDDPSGGAAGEPMTDSRTITVG